MTTTDHRAAAEQWLAEAEKLAKGGDISRDKAELYGSIASAHALLAEPVPDVGEASAPAVANPGVDPYWEAILALPVSPYGNGVPEGVTTIGQFLTRLLSDVWAQREYFGGKRPFGNSAWEWELYGALAAGGYALLPDQPRHDLEKTETDLTKLVDSDAADELIAEAIAYMGRAA